MKDYDNYAANIVCSWKSKGIEVWKASQGVVTTQTYRSCVHWQAESNFFITYCFSEMHRVKTIFNILTICLSEFIPSHYKEMSLAQISPVLVWSLGWNYWWGIEPMKHLFFVVVNKTAHTCWWPWPTPTFVLRATHIEHRLESKRGWQFYTVLPRKLIKPLMLKYLWVLPHLKNQSSSTISAGDWKLVSEMSFQRISKSLHPF